MAKQSNPSLEEVEKSQGGVMVCLYVPKDVAQFLAVPGGEPMEELHVTLAYVKGCGGNADAFREIAESMIPVCEEFAAVTGMIAGSGRFNGSETSDFKDVYYATFSSPVLTTLRERVLDALEGAGFEASDTHGFTPHVTLKYLSEDEGNPLRKPGSSPFTVDQLSIASRSFKSAIPFMGDRVAKDQPTISAVHVDAPLGSGEKKPKKKKAKKDDGDVTDTSDDPTPVAPPTLEEPGWTPPPENNEGVGYEDSYKLAKEVLDSARRDNLSDAEFAIPDERRYPIHDLEHARNALARVSGKDQEAEVRAAVYRKYPELKPVKKGDEVTSLVMEPEDSEQLANRALQDSLSPYDKISAAYAPDMCPVISGFAFVSIFPVGNGMVAKYTARSPGLLEPSNSDRERAYKVIYEHAKKNGITEELTDCNFFREERGNLMTLEIEYCGVFGDGYQEMVQVGKEGVRIAKLSTMKQIAYGVILEPYSCDLQGDVMMPDDIEKTAHDYMENARNIHDRHKSSADAFPVESYIAPQDIDFDGPYGKQTVKKGSWVLGVKVYNNDMWKKVESGEYTGFSVGGIGVRDDV